MKKASPVTPVKKSRRSRVKPVHSSNTSHFLTESSSKQLTKKIFWSIIYFVSAVCLLLLIAFSWSMIMTVIGLAQLIFMYEKENITSDDEMTFWLVASTFIVVGLFSTFKTWRAWFSKWWYLAFWWGIFPLLYCGLCVLLLGFL